MSGFVRTPTVFQMEATECGAASLAMVFAYYGKHVPLEELRIETGASRDGCNAGSIVRTAMKYGMECRGYRKEPADLRAMRPPCILHWNFNHFVVFEGFRGKYACLNDPALGRRKVTMEELDDSFTGVVLAFAPTEAFTKDKKQGGLFACVKRLLSGQTGSVLRLLFAGLLLTFPGIAIPVTAKVFIDDVLLYRNPGVFPALMLILAGTVLLQILLSLYRELLLAKLQKKITLLSAREFLTHLFRLPIRFFDRRYTGDLAERAANDSDVTAFLSGDLLRTVFNSAVALCYLALLFVCSPLLAAVALAGAAVSAGIGQLISARIKTASVKYEQDLGSLSGAVCAGLSVIDTLKASGTENEYVGRILGHSARVAEQEQKLSRGQQVLNAVPEGIHLLTGALLLVLGSWCVIQGGMSVGTLVFFLSLFGAFSMPVEKLVGFVKKIRTAAADVSRTEDILRYPVDEKFSENMERDPLVNKLEGTVELRDISFGYSHLRPPVIAQVSFRIDCGQSIAVVGKSGCGKTTVSRIISGLYPPREGELLFDGTDIRRIPPDILSASIATVSQHITLFSGSIRDNLTMWNPSIPERDIIAAAKDACIHDVISQKPGAYDHHLTEGGANLSGGQRQRLEIARALTTNPTILIMDESTSALDPITEKQIIDNIKRRGCTCVIIAHRLSAIRDCDQILVMDGGRILQRGTHEELSLQSGPYQTLMKNL